MNGKHVAAATAWVAILLVLGNDASARTAAWRRTVSTGANSVPGRLPLASMHRAGLARHGRSPARLLPFVQVADTTGRELYDLGCASCHGRDGRGGERGTTVAFTVPVPDFTDCSFSSREPDADWLAVTHEGGPVRGFGTTMPAFGEAFTVEQIGLILGHVRTFCSDPAWPRGELNLPRALVTEKAFPEDEVVTTLGVDVDGPGRVVNELVYERRFGPRNQIEIRIPFGAAELTGGGGWDVGFGDVQVGFKRAVWHSFERGSIFALGGEVALPTGRESAGLGKGTVVFEPFASFGQIVAGDGFIQLQAALEIPADEGDHAENEALWRGVLGWTTAQGAGFGRSWTPLIEILGARDLESGASATWDLLPQVQVSLNTRQHVLANVGLRLPLNQADDRSTTFLFYILWDWFDGGFFDGW